MDMSLWRFKYRSCLDLLVAAAYAKESFVMEYEISGNFPKQRTKVNVVKKAVVSEENMGAILGVTAFEQHPRINLGDVISVSYFHNGSLEYSGTVTIWHNKDQAAIKTYSANLHGEWLEAQKLIVSEEREVGWTTKGELVTGRLAMDIDGARGIYSCGEFFRNHSDLPAAGA